MDRRTALAAAGATALSVLAVGAAITTNLRPEDADAATTSTELVTSTTLPEPAVVTVVLPAEVAPAAVTPPAAGVTAAAAPLAFDDHDEDHDDDDDDSGHGRGRGRGGDDDRDDDHHDD